MVGMEDDGNVITGCDGANVVGAGNSAGNGSLLLVIGDSLSLFSVEGRNTTPFGASVPFRRSMQHHPGTSGV